MGEWATSTTPGGQDSLGRSLEVPWRRGKPEASDMQDLSTLSLDPSVTCGGAAVVVCGGGSV